ncbi:hypothetical protein RRG08_030978 [Elysia crispata]|uniref:Integrase catalytic domain-containing protein n=1 Tax=Elysia crispata TaxID=231223 RepID=A0AAE0ZTK5_9GAST|nr:hypothetical protein RRG08_030978 [Elysia crispata]
MSEVTEMMGTERRLSTPYHAQSNGMVERFNGTLKNMLHKLTSDKARTWDKLIPAVFFTFREIPNTTTSYPPFTLMHGRQVRGPADIIADICSDTDKIVEEYTFVHDYANGLYQDITKASVSFIKDDDIDLETNIEFLGIAQKEFPSDVMLDEKLSPNQHNEIRLLLQGFPDPLSDLPGRTQRIEHTLT